ELGSGSAEKTRRLIAAALARHGRLHYLPIDVSESAVEESARGLIKAFPTLRVTAFVGDYFDALPEIAERVRGPKLIAFLGSSLGNYAADDAVELLIKVAAVMTPADRLLLGTDLAKDAAVLEPAYDDAQGVTARFNKNLLTRINRELGADFALDAFDHAAVYRPDRGRVEMHLVSRRDQAVTIPGAGIVAEFAAGESIHTENSHKYTTQGLADLARRSGFAEEASWTDPKGWFRLQRWAVA
ncbi:MAG: L-histidine N(alpha)-methyltransferase, partial [Thermoleophilia bacterium]|nr:L-histidine N(alpha)-methyltransferase [Thermoleophilia bacterium]